MKTKDALIYGGIALGVAVVGPLILERVRGGGSQGMAARVSADRSIVATPKIVEARTRPAVFRTYSTPYERTGREVVNGALMVNPNVGVWA